MKRNKVPESVSSPTPGAQRTESRRRRVIDAQERERKLPSMSARDPVKDRPALTPEQRRDLLDGRRGQGSPDYMLGELMNPLVVASSFAFGGLPASGMAALKAAGLSAATMAGLERLSESNPKTAQLVNLGMLALAVPGMANSARRAGVKQLNDLLAEPTEQKLKLLYEMVKHRGVRRGNNPDALHKDPGQVLSNGAKGPRRESSQAWTDIIAKDLDLMLSDAVSELHGRASAQRLHRRTLNRNLRPMVQTQTPMQALKQIIWTHDAEDQQPVKQSRWYADLEKRYGKNRADRMARFVSSSDYADYFLAPGPKGELATDEIAKYAAGRKLINDLTEPGEIVIGGSPGIHLEGTISRETAVPHDLDLSGYIANASRRTDTPFFLKDGKPLSPQVRNEMFAALSNHDNIENAPLIQKLRRLRPELKDAPFRYARYDWEWGNGDQYKPGVFTVVKKPDITKNGNGNVLVTTVVDGYNTDIMLTDAKIHPNSVNPRYGSAETAFDWKDYYGRRSKDLKDKAGYAEFSQNNPVASAVSGRARFSPSRFADSLVTDEGLPVVVDIEQTPGGPTVPMIMNHRGVMLQADDPEVLHMLSRSHLLNQPAYARPATSADKPLVAARVAPPEARAKGAPGEAAPSIGVYRGDNIEEVADILLRWAGDDDDIVVYKGQGTVDPEANLGNVLYTDNGFTGSPFASWRGKYGQRVVPPTRLISDALNNPSAENLEALGRAFGEATRGDAGDMVNRVDNRLRNLLYRRGTYDYAESKPVRFVSDSKEATQISRPGDPDRRARLIKALSDSRFAVPFMAAAGLTMDESEDQDVHQDSKGGDAGEGSEVALPKEPAPATSGARIVINPSVFRGGKDALCVAFNEAFRIVMESMEFNPVSEPTEEQRKFFADTAYSQDENQMRRTILARIATFDTSVKDPTDEQIEETVEFLQSVLEAEIPQTEFEQNAVLRILDTLRQVRSRGTHVNDSSSEASESMPPPSLA